MEKTMEYALNEALETGRRSAMPVFLEKELREKIIQEIDEARKPYLELAKDKTSEDYLYYNGFCNAMNFAKVIVENPNDNN
jgi:hypothetical protein